MDASLYFRDHRVEIPLYTHVYEMLHLMNLSHIVLSDEMSTVFLWHLICIFIVYLCFHSVIHTHSSTVPLSLTSRQKKGNC